MSGKILFRTFSRNIHGRLNEGDRKSIFKLTKRDTVIDDFTRQYYLKLDQLLGGKTIDFAKLDSIEVVKSTDIESIYPMVKLMISDIKDEIPYRSKEGNESIFDRLYDHIIESTENMILYIFDAERVSGSICNICQGVNFKNYLFDKKYLIIPDVIINYSLSSIDVLPLIDKK